MTDEDLESIHDAIEVLVAKDVVNSSATKVQNRMPSPKTPEKQNV